MDTSDIIEIYNQILNQELTRFPKGTWLPTEKGLKNAQSVTKHLIENILKWSRDDVIEKLHYNVFVAYKLGGMLGRVFEGSTFNALDNAYPGEYDPKKMKLAFLGEYSLESEIKRLRYILKDYAHGEIIELYTGNDFIYKYRFNHVIRNNAFNKFGFLELAFPGEFKVWELQIPSIDFWQDQKNRLDAIYWLMDKTQKTYVSTNDFNRNGLKKLLCFYENPKAVNALKEALNIPTQKEFSDFLMKQHKVSGLTKKEFAGQLGIHFGTFYAWVDGRQSPSFWTVLKICEHMGINLRKDASVSQGN